MQLAEALQLRHRQVVAGQMQQRIEQHRAVAVGQHEAVAVGPRRIGGVVPQVMVPQHFRDLRHAHRHAGMAGIGLLHGIHRERADGVGQLGAISHRRILGLAIEVRQFDYYLLPTVAAPAAHPFAGAASLIPSCFNLR